METLVLNVYNSIQNTDHCCVCFRTERQLVRPKAIKELSKRNCLPPNQFSSNKKNVLNACYMCEKKAEAALKFQKILYMSYNLKMIFDRMKSKKKKKRPFEKGESASLYEKHLKTVRDYTQLLQTEVLHIANYEASDPVEQCREDFDILTSKLPDNDLETVVIIDDETTEPPPLQPLTFLHSSPLSAQPLHMCQPIGNPIQPNSVPYQPTSDPLQTTPVAVQTTVPIQFLGSEQGMLMFQIPQSNIVMPNMTQPCLPQTQPFVRPTQPYVQVSQPGVQPTQLGVQSTQPGVQPTQPGVQLTQLGIQPTQPGVQPTQPGVQLTQLGIQPTQPGVQLTQPAVQSIQPGVQPTQPSVQPTQPVTNMIIIHPLRRRKSLNEDNASLSKRGREEGNIDWEDKIPMDVISFMEDVNEKQPNKKKRISPMGMITDVRSITSDDIENRTQPVINNSSDSGNQTVLNKNLDSEDRTVLNTSQDGDPQIVIYDSDCDHRTVIGNDSDEECEVILG